MTHRQVRGRGRSAEESALNGWCETESHFIDLSPAPAPLHRVTAPLEPERISDSTHRVTRMGGYPRERA